MVLILFKCCSFRSSHRESHNHTPLRSVNVVDNELQWVIRLCIVSQNRVALEYWGQSWGNGRFDAQPYRRRVLDLRSPKALFQCQLPFQNWVEGDVLRGHDTIATRLWHLPSVLKHRVEKDLGPYQSLVTNSRDGISGSHRQAWSCPLAKANVDERLAEDESRYRDLWL